MMKLKLIESVVQVVMKWPLTVREFIGQSDRYYGSDALYVQPVTLDSADEIIIDNRGPKPVLRIGRWRGKVTLFYEEKPMFVTILMSDESLCNTAICDTRAEAIDAAVKFVGAYSSIVDLQTKARGWLELGHAYSFAEGGFNYTVHVGKST